MVTNHIVCMPSSAQEIESTLQLTNLRSSRLSWFTIHLIFLTLFLWSTIALFLLLIKETSLVTKLSWDCTLPHLKCLDRYAEYICRNLDFLECVLAHHCSKFFWYKPLLYRPECSTHWGSPSKQRRRQITLLWDDAAWEPLCLQQNMSVWPYALLPKAGNQDIQQQQMKSTSNRSRPKNVKRSIRLETCDG